VVENDELIQSNENGPKHRQLSYQARAELPPVVALTPFPHRLPPSTEPSLIGASLC